MRNLLSTCRNWTAFSVLAGAFLCRVASAQSQTAARIFPPPTRPDLYPRTAFSAPPATGKLPPTGSFGLPLDHSPLTTLVTSWDGIQSDFTLEPPDPHGAAGPNGILQVVNVQMAYWDKSGRAIWGPIPLDGFFSGVGNQFFTFDPHAQYDPQSGRFYVMILEEDDTTQHSFVNLAVSKSSDPRTGTTNDWFIYRIENTQTNVAGVRFWGDYPGFGFDSQAIYVTVNAYSFITNAPGDALITVFNKASLLSGTTNYNFIIIPGGPLAAFTLQPCTVRGTNSPGNVAYFAETPITTTVSNRIWALSDPLGARILRSALVAVPDNGGPIFGGAPQPGTPITIDTLDERTQGNAFWFNNSIWFCHTAGGKFGKSTAHYYRVDINGFPAGAPVLGEAGLIDGGPGEWTYQPSIGGNAVGDVCLVYSQSSLSRFPTIMATTRKAGAPSFDAPLVIKVSPSFYFGGRWGDFGSSTPDPVDDSFWVTHEWARSANLLDWGTWWANVLPKTAPNLLFAGSTITGGNGNGIIDFNECNQLTLALTNTGSLGATNLQATLSSLTPGVIVVQGSSTYPDMPIGGVGTNLVPFRISTQPDFICGTPVLLNLVLKSDQDLHTNQVTLPSGFNGPPLRYDNGSAFPIPDNDPNGVSSPVTVTNIPGAISKVTVSLYITHTFDADLTLQLIGPDGTTANLSANNGGSGQNYGLGCSPDSSRTTFDDDAANAISSSVPPFTGSFRPDQPLSVFSGKSGTNANGVWKLHVVDGFQFDVGTIQCWSLMVSAPTCVDGGGECPGADLALTISGHPDPVILGDNLIYTLTVVNNGPSTAKNVVLSQVLPSSVIFVSATPSQGGAGQAGGVVTCSIGTLPPKATATVTVVVFPTATGDITTSATSTSNQPDFDSSNNNPVLITHVLPPTSDLVVGLSAIPASALVGGPLTYFASVTNNGPSAATGLTLTNTFPVGISLLGATPSQGSATIFGNTVICSFGTVTNSGRATVTINATPTGEGTFVATATATANQFDPNTANNTASASVIVGASSDLGITITDTPDPVVVRSNVTYTILVTNRGPSIATSVVVNNTLPSNATLISTNSTQGTITRSGNTVTCNIGTMSKNASATITIVISPTNSGPISATSTVSATQADPNPADNTATATTVVAPPFLSIAAAGANLTSESFSPPNGVVDIGETVTVTLRLRNVGNVRNTNLVATLLATNGVTPVGGTQQTYGVLQPSGFPVGRPFSFTANGVNAGTVTAVLQLRDGTNNIGTASYIFNLPDVHVFSNTAPITIQDNTNALPYPSIINVSGLTGIVGKVTVTLSNLNHTFPQDIDALVVGAGGQNTILMSGAGAPPVSGADVAFDDSATSPIPDGNGQIVSGSYQPADYLPEQNLLPPAPSGPYPAAMSSLNTSSPNGQWSLYVDDHTAGDVGMINGGWSLALSLVVPVNQVADLSLTGSASPDPSLAGGLVTYTFTVTNSGPNSASFVAFTNNLPAGVSFVSASASQGIVLTNGNTVVGNLGPMAAGAAATVTVSVSPSSAGQLVNTASVSSTETDLNPANNSVTVSSTVNLPIADAGLTVTATPNPVVVGSNLTYTCIMSNGGPQTALNVVLTDPLPSGVSYVTSSCSVGSIVNISGTITCFAGNLSPGASATATIVVSPTAAGSVTNTVSLATASSDTNSANNSVTSVVVAANPAPIIAAAGARLTSESFQPPNGAIDPGEQVTVQLSLKNVGSLDTANLSATLLDSGGVTPVGNPLQTYGVLHHGGAPASQPFTFTASGAGGSQVTATLQLADGGQSLGTVTFTFTLSATASLSNPSAIIIPDHGPAVPYPSTITVSGQTGLVSRVTATLSGISHTFPRDINALLVSPAGGSVVLMSHVGSAYALTNVTLTFDDAASSLLPINNAISSGTYLPTTAGNPAAFPAPAPGGSHGSAMAALNGADANGTWSLYILDDSIGDAGQVASGWSLNITTVTTVNPVADVGVSMSSSPSSLFVGAGLTSTIGVTNAGPAAASGVVVSYPLPEGVLFVSATPSQGSFAGVSNGVVLCNLGGIVSGAAAGVTIVVAPSLNGTITNTATVSANESDLNPANNTAQTVTSVATPAPVRLSGTMTNGNFEISGTGQPGLPYAILISSNLNSWVYIGTNTANAGGTFKFVDVNAISHGLRFYRAARVLP